MSEPHLRAAPPLSDDGELETLDSLRAEIRRKDAVIRGQERDIRGWMVRYRQLEEDSDVTAREHALWTLAEHLFHAWQYACKHPKTHWTEGRFWLVEPYLSKQRYGRELEQRYVGCCRAIMGARHDAYVVRRKNGTTWRWDEWDRIYGSVKDYEEFKEKAPTDWQPALSLDTQALIATCEEKLKLQRKRRRA
jgi:hypothetical protein